MIYNIYKSRYAKLTTDLVLKIKFNLMIMKNKDILKYLEWELNSFTNIKWEIKETEDYILFIKTLSNLAVSFKNQELWKPLWISISDILKDKEEMYKLNNI